MAIRQHYVIKSHSLSSAEESGVIGESRIIVVVGERRFVTAASTLRESGVFTDLLFGRWGELNADKTFFMDMDGDVFVHTLRYLRNGVLPVFYDKSVGHNYFLYAMLLDQARRLVIPRLQNWLEEKGYLQAITVTSSINEVYFKHMVPEKTATNVDVEYRIAYPENCETDCPQARQGSKLDDEDEDAIKVLRIRREIEFHQEICLDGGKIQTHVWV